MYIVFYFVILLSIVLVTLGIYYVTNSRKRMRPRQLACATQRFNASFGERIASGDFRLPDRDINRLAHTLGLEAFYEACKELDAGQRRRILLDNQSAIIELQMRQKSPTTHAFFAYLLRDLDLFQDYGDYGTLMLRFLDDDSVYARENALKAIYSFGDAQLVADALAHLSSKGIPHNEKLVSDGLLAYQGDKELLADLLMRRYDELLECYRNALINYLGHTSIDRYDDMLIEEAQRQGASVDTVCAVTRKINKAPSMRNLGFLKDLIGRYEGDDRWEPVATAVSGLGRYHGNADVKELLKGKLVSPNWFIRKNSAASLASIGLTQEDVDDVYATGDRYAADAIGYELERLAYV